MKKVLRAYVKCYRLLERRRLSVICWVGRFMLLVVSFVLPFLFSSVIGILGNGTESVLVRNVLWISLLMGLKVVLQASIFFAELFIEKDTRISVKKQFLAHLLNIHPSDSILYNTARTTEILYSDVNSITTIVFSTWGLINDIILASLAGVFLVVINPILLILISLLLCVTAFSSYKFSHILGRLNKNLRLETDKNYKSVRDIILNMKSIKTANAVNYFITTFGGEVERIKRNIIKRDTTSWSANQFGKIMENIGLSFFLLVGGILVLRGRMSLPHFIMFSSYSGMFSSSITRLLAFNPNMQPLIVSVDRVFELFNYKDRWHGTKTISTIHEICIIDASFGYQETPVLQNLSCEFHKGNCYCIVGSNGSGKTTLLNLLAGTLCALNGKVLYDGCDVNDISYMHIQRQISFFSQDDVIFDISILDNLLLFEGGEMVSLEDVKAICRELSILDKIESLPNGYDTVFSDTYKMSFGQKRKILLSRVFLKPSSAILLDEPLSGIDKESQADIVKAIESLSQNKLVIVATHRADLFDFVDESHRIVLTSTH